MGAELRIARHPDWQTRLRGALWARNTTPFQWGKHDCSISICDVLLAIAEIPDPGAPWRGKYRTWTGAYRSLKAYLARRAPAFAGWHTGAPPAALPIDEVLRWAATARALELGLRPVEPIKAQRGDPIVARAICGGNYGLETDCLGIVGLGSEVLVAGDTGWTEVSADRIVAAWRLP